MRKIKAKSNTAERETMPFIDGNEFSLQMCHIVSETVKVLQGELGFTNGTAERLREMALEHIMYSETMQIKCVAIPIDLLRKEGIVL